MSQMKQRFSIPYFVAVLSFSGWIAFSSVGRAQLSDDATFGSRSPEAEAAYKAGLAQMGQENWEQAIVAFSKAISIDDTYPEALLGRADALRKLEDYRSALTGYQDALNFLEGSGPSPQAAAAYNGRGVCYRELGQVDLALTDFNNAIEMDRSNPEIAANYGDLLVNRVGDPTTALRYLDKAIELDPENAEAFRNRGMAHAQLHEFDEAVEDLQKSIELDPNDYETYTTLASIHIAQEDLAPAVEDYTRAIEKYTPKESSDPKTFVDGYLRRGEARLQLALEDDTPPERRQELYEAVIADTDRVLEEYPDRFPNSGLALFQRGSAMRLQGRLNEAIKSLTDAIQIIPSGTEAPYQADAYLKRGICWHYQGQDSLARGDFEQAASINFSDPLPHLWIGITYAQEGDYRSAIESYGNAIAKAPNFPAPYVNRGLAYMQLEGYQKAIDNFNEAIRNEPSEPEHFFKRGLAYMKLEDYQKAFDSFHLATLNDETMGKAFRGAAKALEAMGRSGLAEQYENRAKALETATH